MRTLTYSAHWLVCLPLVLCSLNGAQGQSAGSGPITNIRVELDSERVKVLYDAVGITSRDSIYLLVESQSRGLLNVVTVTGDVGSGGGAGQKQNALLGLPAGWSAN